MYGYTGTGLPQKFVSREWKSENDIYCLSLWRVVVLLHSILSIVESLWVTPAISSEAEQYGWITTNGLRKIISKSNKNLYKCYDFSTAGRDTFPFVSLDSFTALIDVIVADGRLRDV